MPAPAGGSSVDGTGALRGWELPAATTSALSVLAALCLAAAVVVGGHPAAGPVIVALSVCVVLIGVRSARRERDRLRGASSVAALAVTLVVAIWTLTTLGSLAESAGIEGATMVALWPAPLVVGVLLYAAISRIRILGLVDDWFSLGVPDRASLLLTAVIVPISALGLVIWARAVGDAGRGQSDYVDLLDGRAAVVVVLAALTFALINAAAEEMAFNGVAQRALGHDFPPGAAVGLAASMFGASHWFGFPSGWWGVVLAGSYGLVLSVLRHLSGGLALPWIAHVLADLTIVAVLVTIW